MVLGVTLLDLVSGQGVTVRYSREGDSRRQYRNRTGFPHGIEKARGAAKGLKLPA
ncbi:MAG: hypothetical protein QOD93_5983 [Acetobacteraceae bacterium]|jgi:hypothetical protein|nr:hypothetical protein [Rhodopila sp.]MEA2773021.1 hypothetical protein [Acetobacteraceae bacterium]